MMRVVSLWAPVMVFVIGLLITQGPVLNPDALEMGLVGEGFWGDGPEGLDPHYYPPVFPFLSAVFSVFLPGHAAVLLLSPLAMCGLFMCLWVRARAITMGLYWHILAARQPFRNTFLILLHSHPNILKQRPYRVEIVH